MRAGAGGCKPLLLLAGAFLSAQVALAADFVATRITTEERLHRSPTINERGDVAWYSLKHGSTDPASAHVYLYRNGEVQNLSEGASGHVVAGHIRPSLGSNVVAWTTTYHEDIHVDVSWVLREPPPNPDDPHRELDANYQPRAEPDAAAGSVGRQWFAEPITNAADGADGAPPYRPARRPSGGNEIVRWSADDGFTRVTQDTRNDLAPSVDGDLLVWQKAKGWPFGWEIMALRQGNRYQLTTNFYYDMAPRAQGDQVAWYGWDGHDFEIYLHDAARGGTLQVTSNEYDDVSPVLWGGSLAWEGYPAVESDIYLWRNGQIQQVSENIEDDVNPRIWNGQVVWQGFDGDDFEIYLFDGAQTIKLTSNIYDDVNPEIRDGLIVWMSYVDNWDAEIMVWDGVEASQLTDNDYEDASPQTAGGRVVWQAELGDGSSHIYRAERR